MVATHHVSRRVWITVGLIAVVSLFAAYYLIGPESGLYPRCMFRQLSGLECPGCGSQRAIHALLHGHISEAWSYNALLLIEMPLIALMLAAGSMSRHFPRLHAALNSRTLIVTLLVTIIGWTIIRNLLNI